MNAKHLTLISSALALLLSKFMLMPAWSEHKRMRLEREHVASTAASVSDAAQITQKLPTSAVPLHDRAQALAAAVNVWSTANVNYGIRISQITPVQTLSGQNTVDIAAFSEIDNLTRLPVQRLLIKGQYSSLFDFKRFVQQEMSAGKAITLDKLTLAGDSFELQAGVFAKAQ